MKMDDIRWMKSMGKDEKIRFTKWRTEG